MINGVRISDFRRRLLAREPLVGTFLKTPSAAVAEVLCLSGLDCICIDTEHAPFDRSALEGVLLAMRAHDMPSLVRIRAPDATECLNALDLGATGIIAPHVTSALSARQLAAVCRFQPDGRGYAGSTRAAGYGSRPMSEVIAEANSQVCVIAQIEDAQALADLEQIATVDGVDALFIGRMDLTVSLGASSPQESRVLDAVRAVCAVGAQYGRTVGMFTQTTDEARAWLNEGSSFFLLGSDQQWILQGAKALRGAFPPWP
jgi:2-keto-3-deoxy-L-rhamnonate aldolase RhmA